jgi:hypothetical protein
VRFLGFFRFVSKKFRLFRLFRYLSETPKQTGKIFLGFAKQTEKQPKQIEFRFVSFEPKKKFDRFEDTTAVMLGVTDHIQG